MTANELIRVWLKDHAEKYHGRWVCMKLGKFQTDAPTRHELIAKMTGVRDCLLINLLDLKKPQFEKWSWAPTPQPQPPQPLAESAQTE